MRTLKGIVIALLASAIALWLAVQISPRPAITAIEWLFDRGAAQTSAALAKHVPASVETVVGEAYQRQPTLLTLDLHRPADTASRPLPLMVWIHGGAFVSGRKEDVAAYAKLYATRGLAVASVDYTLAPDANYPTQLRQVNAALAHLVREAPRLGIDPQRVLLAGDSAGAQLAAQMAAVSTSPAYAQAVGIVPALAATQVRAVLLFCGVYDFAQLDYDGVVGFFLRAVAWGFLGERDFRSSPSFEQASVLRHVTTAFPPAFITAGNGDPLLPQSRALAARLGELGVPTETLFYAAADLAPPLGHEYQFDLDRAEGRAAFNRSADFVAAQLR